ncbi:MULTISPECIES: sensor histidine kinase [Actinomadura]|uniref:histidine kinase n=3 Tax=Actinomadura madurae TaxID=1993 RepID=A0A1I4XRQ5_9ACTN|nr:HAMP domain-containing sensor histidine kinase [Actinomadura madurae]SFN28133.1 Signal transduction histidine kinase [Actinomadura madurae]SPT63589.1 Signal transduction histidine-protein kinase ArlS [Actinomadura madurae]
MARRPASVRARTTLGATVVVAAALVAAGLAVVVLLRANLAGRAELEAEVAAREVAGQLATGTPYASLDLPDPDEHPVQVVGEDGRVRAVSEDVEAIGGTGSPAVRPGPPARGDDDEGRGGEGRDDDPGRGEVADGDPDFTTGSVTVDGRTADYRFAAVEVTTPRDDTVTVYAGADLGAAREAAGTATRAMLGGLPPLLAVVAGVTWLVTRRALRPVEAVRAELAAITSSGDLARRVPVPDARDEIAGLAVTTNETLAALEESVARQRGFVADASHELRSPIASLRTQLEVAAAHPGLLDVDGLVEDVVRLQHLAADLLLLARIDAGDRPPARPVLLGGLVRDELERRTGDRIPVEPSIEGDPRVMGVPGRLSRVVGNLLDNAERYAGTAVRLSLREEAGAAVLRVADDGPGVPPGDRERIFERFVRLDDARSRDDGGAGLGLAIARDLVLAHGGAITVGDAPGGGALFEVRLPVTSGAGGR